MKLVQQAPQDHLALLGHQVRLGLLEKEDLPDQLVHQVHQDNLVRLDLLVLQDKQDHVAQIEDQQDRQVSQDLQGPQGPQVLEEIQGNVDHLDPQDNLGLLAREEILVQKVWLKTTSHIEQPVT